MEQEGEEGAAPQWKLASEAISRTFSSESSWGGKMQVLDREVKACGVLIKGLKQ